MRRDLEDELRRHLIAGMDPESWAKEALVCGRVGSFKQVLRTLEKWSVRGEYDWGVSIWKGWLTPKGAALT